MCGIAGWLGQMPAPDVVAANCCRALARRGPDGHGARLWDHAGLAHTRLKIIDLRDVASQPMSNEDGTIFMVFNGEIYNHRELQTWLEARGHVFGSRCDAEVIPHLYEEDGAAFVTRLRGMFALALLDRRRDCMLLARDRFGIKPLVYGRGATEEGEYLAFASEINAIREMPGLDMSVDVQAVSDFMALSYIPAPQTIYQGVHSLEPGELVQGQLVPGTVELIRERYHNWTLAPEIGMPLGEAVHRAEPLLEQAVGRQIESDVPLGAMLSGGIDSSLVSAMAQKSLPNQLRTFNVRFPDAAYDETPAALAVSGHIHSEHLVLDMDSEGSSWASITGLLRYAGQPFADTSIFGVNAVSKLMRKHVTVALAGDGGDEAFGGYSTFSQIRRASLLARVPRRVGAPAGGSLSLLSKRKLISAQAAAAVGNLSGQDDATVLQYLLSWVRPKEHANLFRDHDLLSPVRHFERQWRWEPQGRTTRLERLSMLTTEVWTRLILANDFLPKVDMASMKESLEVRVPMLDEDLFDFGLRLPQDLKLNKGQNKPVLREVARGVIPADVAAMPKHGFGVPVDVLSDYAFKSRLGESLLGSDSGLTQMLDRSAYAPVVDAFCSASDLPGISRQGLYQRAIMLLALNLALTNQDSRVAPSAPSGRSLVA